MKTRYFKYSVRRGADQHFSEVPVGDQTAMIGQCVNLVAAPANIEFIYERDEADADLRFSFWNNTKMKELGGGDFIPGGLAGRDWIALNNERPGLSWRFAVVVLVMHEVCHFLGRKHTTDPTSMMYYTGSNYFNVDDVNWLRRRYGTSAEKFYPYDKGLAGNAVNAHKPIYHAEIKRLTLERYSLLAERDRVFGDPGKTYLDRVAAQNAVLRQLASFTAAHEAMAKIAARWFDLDKKWRGI